MGWKDQGSVSVTGGIPLKAGLLEWGKTVYQNMALTF